MKSKRTFRYFSIAWVLVSLVLTWAMFYSCLDGFRGVRFSLREHDVHELPKNITDVGWMEDDTFVMETRIDLSHETIHYLRIETQNLENRQAFLSLITYDEDWNTVFSIMQKPLKNGINDIKLSSQDFAFVGYKFYGVDRNSIKSIQYRQSVETPDYTKATVLSIVVVVISTILLSIFQRALRY